MSFNNVTDSRKLTVRQRAQIAFFFYRNKGCRANTNKFQARPHEADVALDFLCESAGPCVTQHSSIEPYNCGQVWLPHSSDVDLCYPSVRLH
jgi:hypothetical protein